MAECQGSIPLLISGDRRLQMGKREQHYKFKLLAASLSSNAERQDPVELRAGLWGSLPEEILQHILMRLPTASQCRLRCVCSRWKLLLLSISDAVGRPPRPTCTFRSGGEYSHDSFFCHEERNWFRLPFQPRRQLGPSWFAMGSDGGLLCFVRYGKKRFELLICNPITGSHVRLFPMYRYLGADCLEFSNFLVNLETKTFKLVFMSSKETLIFDSQSQEWKLFHRGPEACPGLPKPLNSDPGFLWKGKIFKRAQRSCGFHAFDLESGTWSTLRDDGFPSGCDTEHFYHLDSWKDQVVLVQLHPMQEDPVRIWMLHDCPNSSALIWEKVPVEIPDKMRTLVGELRTCLSHGDDYIYFAARKTHHWVKYGFKTRLWCVMPRPLNRDADLDNVVDDFEWGNFEPQTFMNPKADDQNVQGNEFLLRDGADSWDEYSESDYSDFSDAERDRTDGSDADDDHADGSDADDDHANGASAEGHPL